MALFAALNKQYKALKRFTWLSLRTLDSINFVYFEAYRSRLVDVRKRDALPAPEDPEYRYTPTPPELIPPIGSHSLVHLLENPTCAELEPLCLSRFPKKLKEQLTFVKGMKPGWGLQIVSRFVLFRQTILQALPLSPVNISIHSYRLIPSNSHKNTNHFPHP